VVRAHERLRATVCDRDTAKLLGLKLGAPMLEINRTAMSYHNTPVELRRSLVNTAAHEYWNDLGKPESQPQSQSPGPLVPAGPNRTARQS
jgi:GntR family transcriptional regulator